MFRSASYRFTLLGLIQPYFLYLNILSRTINIVLRAFYLFFNYLAETFTMKNTDQYWQRSSSNLFQHHCDFINLLRGLILCFPTILKKIPYRIKY